MVDFRGNAYEPSPPPQSDDQAAFGRWAAQEFGRIASAIRLGRCQMLTMDVLTALPDKPVEGMTICLVAGVVQQQEGLYEYSGGKWNKL